MDPEHRGNDHNEVELDDIETERSTLKAQHPKDPHETEQEPVEGCCRVLGKYAFDWVTAICVAALGGLPQVLVEPAHQKWSLNEPAYQLPEGETRVQSIVLFITMFFIPLVLIFVLLVLPLVLRKGTYNPRRLHHGLLGIVFTVALELFFQGLLSVTTGGLRPDFYHRCKPDTANFVVGEQPTCLTTESLTEGRRSFPCGHCSFAMSGGAYFAQFLWALLDPWDGRGHVWKHVLVAVPPLGATLIGMTRFVDAKHHPWDIAIGLAIGLGASIIGYNTFHAPLWSRYRGQPWCVRDTTGMPKHLVNDYLTSGPTPPKPEPDVLHAITHS